MPDDRQPWLVEGSTAYRLVQDGWYRGKAAMRNEFTIQVQGRPVRTQAETEALAARICELLNAADGKESPDAQ